jgi:transcriptional regulator GlxA family with amidase domain
MSSPAATVEPRAVAILLFDDVEVLDFAGPFEVFSVAGRRSGIEPFRVYTVAEKPGPVQARNGLSINPHYTLATCPRPDILVVPGGFGTRPLMHNSTVVDWVRARSKEAELTFSICTGALVLGRAGLLDGLEATTHHLAFDELRAAAPRTTVRSERQVVDNGHVITSAGIAAGIEAALHIVGRLLGTPMAVETAQYMEYRWTPPS